MRSFVSEFEASLGRVPPYLRSQRQPAAEPRCGHEFEELEGAVYRYAHARPPSADRITDPLSF